MLLSFGAPTPAFADESAPSEKRVVRVASYADGDYMSIDKNGEHTGYEVDYFNEIARYANWTYEYVD